MIKRLLLALALIGASVPAYAGLHGGGATPLTVSLTQRSLLSLGYVYNNPSYAWINFFRGGNSMWVPSGAGWNTSSQPFNASITDSAGNITYSFASSLTLGSSVVVPTGAEYSGPYCFDSNDTTHAQSFTVTFQSVDWTQASNTTCANGACTGSGTSLVGNVLTVSGTNWCIPLNYSGTAHEDHVNITENDPSATGAYERGLRLYEQPDATDLAAGLVYRRAFKQPIVNGDFGFIRLVNWAGPNDQSDTLGARFENRTLPTAGETSYSGFNVCDVVPYPNIAGTDTYTLAAGTAAGCSPLSTPASLQHGEIVIARVPNANSQGGCVSGVCPSVIGISNASNAVVTTPQATNLSIGQTVILYISQSGMTDLNLYPVTVASIGSPTTASFTGEINSTCGGSGSGYALDITAVSSGAIQIGMTITGSSILNGGTIINGFVSGTLGGPGCYTVNSSQTAGSGAMTGALAAATSTASFTGQIGATCGGTGTGTSLDVTAVASGTITVGMGVTDSTGQVNNNTYIAGQVSGTAGGIGCYTVSVSQSAVASEAMFGYISSSVSLNFNSTSAGTFDLATCGSDGTGCFISPYITLNLNGLGAHPLVQVGGFSPITLYNTLSIPANSYGTFVYDKLLYAETDGSGNPIYGVWHYWGSGSYGAFNWGVPIELQVELINELNAMLPAGRPPINIWFNLPRMALVSTDPDYSSASEYGVNALNVILNGANGYAGLCAKCAVMVELSDEDWNNGYGGTFWMAAVGFQRWGSSLTTLSDFNSYSTLRSLWVMNDIKNSAYFQSGRVFFDRGGQQVAGTTGAPNGPRIYGNYAMMQDAQYPLGTPTTFTGSQSGTTLAGAAGLQKFETITDSTGTLTKPTMITAIIDSTHYTVNSSKTVGSETMQAALAPMTLWDIFTGSVYFTPSSSVINADMIQASNDAATFGINSTQVAADVNQIADDTASGSGQSTISSTETQDTAFAAAIGVFGTNKFKGDYEGGLQLNYANYTGLCANCATYAQAVIALVYQSQEWANNQEAYFTWFKAQANLAVPGVYALNNYSSTLTAGWLWANCYSPDSYAMVGGTETEGAGVTPNCNGMASYNATLSNWLLRRDLDPASNDNTPAFLNKAA